MWEEYHQSFYSLKFVKDTSLMKGPDIIIKYYDINNPKIIKPIEERMQFFLKEYMEEFYLPWLWTLQNIFNKNIANKSIFKDILDVKLFRHGEELVRKMKIETDEFDSIMKNNIYQKVSNFIKNKLKDNIIQVYWDLDKDNNIINKIKIFTGGKKITDNRTLKLSLNMGVFTGELVKSRLPFPHNLEYEKTFYPFLILTKKRYVGNKYEFEIDNYKQDYNGIVLKRRDNAPIVKKYVVVLLIV
jgi:hypothetical protein